MGSDRDHIAEYVRRLHEAALTIRWLLNGHPDARAQAKSWLAAYSYHAGRAVPERLPCLARNQFGVPCDCPGWQPTDDLSYREKYCQQCGHHNSDHPEAAHIDCSGAPDA